MTTPSVRTPVLALSTLGASLLGLSLLVFGAMVPSAALFVPGFMVLIVAVGLGVLAISRISTRSREQRC